MNKVKSMSILASDLIGAIKFDSTQTIPAMDISSNQYDEGMNLYLQALGVTKIDKTYNQAVRRFELELEEQEIAAKLQANLAAETQANRAVEAQPGLGTGAAAVAAEGRQHALSGMQETIEQNIAEVYQEGVTSISEDYQTELESILGKYDAATDTFAGLAEYQNMANAATEALFKTIALTINSNINTFTDEWRILLEETGYIESYDATTGDIVLTEKGEMAIDRVVNSITTGKVNSKLGNRTYFAMIAEQMAMAGYNLNNGENAWFNLSDEKRAEELRKYESWLYNNQNNLRISSWDLYEETESGIVLDTIYEQPSIIDSEFYNVGIDADSGKTVYDIQPEDIGVESNDSFNSILKDIESGKITDGEYFTFNRDKAEEGDKYYIVYNGIIYDTQYTVDDPPPVIKVGAANVLSFGRFQDSGKSYAGSNTKQDKWVQEIIDSAKSGKIPDGQLIAFNYGAVSNTNYGLYRYDASRESFVKVDMNEKWYYDYDRDNNTWTYNENHGYFTIGELLASNNAFDDAFILRYANATGQTDAAKKYLNW